MTKSTSCAIPQPKRLLERRDTLIVASVSCIYGLGSPEAYFEMMVYLEEGMTINRDQMLRKLVDIQYQRSDYDFHRGTFRVRGDIVEIFPAYEDRSALRIEFFDETHRIDWRDRSDPRQSCCDASTKRRSIRPATMSPAQERMKQAIRGIRQELKERLTELRDQQKLLEAQRLEQRTLYDLELIGRDGLLSRALKTIRAISPGANRASRRRPCSTIFRGIFCSSSTKATLRCRRSAACIAATARAKKLWSNMVFVCPRR